MNPVVVHGGGPEITSYMRRLDLPVEFVDGLRVSSEETVEVAKMVLVGKVNKDIVLLINRHGQPAVGLCGDDGLLFRASRQPAPSGQDIGFVGRIDASTSTCSTTWPRTTSRWWPASAPTARKLLQHQRRRGRGGRGQGAGRLQADVPDRRARLAERPLRSRQRRVRGRGRRDRGSLPSIAGGMRPKLQACLDAIDGGVSNAHIVDGRVPHSLLLELFTDAGRAPRSGRAHEPAPSSRRSSASTRSPPTPATRWSSSAVPAAGCGTRTATSTSTSGGNLGAERRPLPSARGRGGPRAGRAG